MEQQKADASVLLQNAVFQYLVCTEKFKSAEELYKEAHLELYYSSPLTDLLQPNKWKENNLLTKLWSDYLCIQHGLPQTDTLSANTSVPASQPTEYHNSNYPNEKNATYSADNNDMQRTVYDRTQATNDVLNPSTAGNFDHSTSNFSNSTRPAMVPMENFFTFGTPTTVSPPASLQPNSITSGIEVSVEQLQPLSQAFNATLISGEDTTASEDSGRFVCTYPGCNKSFSTSAILKRHIKEHSGERPFACTAEGCNKRFARKYDLKVHMRSHTGEKPYSCTFPGCERKFSRSSDLRLHERIHKGDKPFVCDCEGCRKRFVRYADLKKHKRTHEVHEGHHPHQHGVGCGHTAIQHDDHIDYLHNNHLHNHHHDHIDDHTIDVSTANPVRCKPTFECGHHQHDESCGHELVPHFDHFDFLVDGRLHYVHNSHCDDHGWIDVIDWDPLPDKKDDTGVTSDGNISDSYTAGITTTTTTTTPGSDGSM